MRITQSGTLRDPQVVISQLWPIKHVVIISSEQAASILEDVFFTNEELSPEEIELKSAATQSALRYAITQLGNLSTLLKETE